MDIIRDAVRKLEGESKNSNKSRPTNRLAGSVIESADIQLSPTEEFPTGKALTPDELSMLRITHGAMRNENVYVAFSSLRTHIIQRLGRHDCSIVVAAVSPGGGASFVSMNLAAAFASDESHSAILVDCNFSGRRFKEFGDDESVPGITDYIFGTAAAPLENLLTDVGIPRLRLLPGGRMRSNRAEFFTRPRAQKMFEELRGKHRNRTIIVDAPPPSISANANVIAVHCDAVLLVVPYGSVTQQDVRVAARSFPAGKVIGSVFNDIPHWRTAK